jgi:hypothetical protein
MIGKPASETDYSKDSVACEHCGTMMWDTGRGRMEMQLHEAECDGHTDPRERFDVADRVQMSDFGMARLDEGCHNGEIVAFSQEDHLVRVQWDHLKTPKRLDHQFVKPIEEAMDDV